MAESSRAPGAPASPGREDDLARVERLYGRPRTLSLRVAMHPWEFDLLRYSKRDGRWRDVTILIPYEGRLVCIVKHSYPEGIARPPSGGVVPGESLDAAAEREAYEETGLRVAIRHYLLRVQCDFTVGERAVPQPNALAEASRRGKSPDNFFDEIAAYATAHPVDEGASEPWESHVFWGVPRGGVLGPLDVHEVKEVALVAPDDLVSRVHGLMRASGIGGFRYRVALQEEALAAARAGGLLP